jgi:hypothetical protein
MGTKRNPGKFDCHAKADPDTELFTLVSTDELMPHLIRYWVWLKLRKGERWNEGENMAEVRQGAKHNEKLEEALACADRAAQQRIARNHGRR